MKKSIKLLLIVVSITVLSSCAKKDDNTLVVGMELQYPPFEMTDAKGEPAGISVDLAYALGDYLNKDVEIQNIAWSGLIPAIQSGKIDVIISSMSIKPDREKSVSFSKPYASASLGILANKDSGIKNIEDINQEGKSVVVKIGTTGYLYAVDHLPKAQVITIDKADTAILEVSLGKSDAFLYDQMTIYNAQKQYTDSTIAILEPFEGATEPWAMAVAKDNDELLNSINDFIDEFYKQGGFDELGDKYLKEMKDTFAKLGLDFFFQPLD